MEILQGDRQVAEICKDKGNTAGGCLQKIYITEDGVIDLIYILSIFMLMAGYYSLTYGVSLWRDDHKRLGSVGVILISVLGIEFDIYIYN